MADRTPHDLWALAHSNAAQLSHMRVALAELYELGRVAGATATIAAIGAMGFESATEEADQKALSVLSDLEQEILYDAIRRIVALRVAPDSPASLPPTKSPAGTCHRPGCFVCEGAR